MNSKRHYEWRIRLTFTVIKYELFVGAIQLIFPEFLNYKRVIRVISGVGVRDSCRGLFRELRYFTIVL
jgi:hypothetical protein